MGKNITKKALLDLIETCNEDINALKEDLNESQNAMHEIVELIKRLMDHVENSYFIRNAQIALIKTENEQLKIKISKLESQMN